MRRIIERFGRRRRTSGDPPQAVQPPAAPDSAPDATTQFFDASAAALLGCLVVEAGPEGLVGARFRIQIGEMRIGRGIGCDVVLRNPLVSREHAALVATGTELWLVHRSATNPTFLNGRAVLDRIALHDGDRVQVADVLLRLESPLVPRASAGVRPSLPQAMEDRMELEERIEREFVREGSFLDVDVVDSYGLKLDTAPERVVVSFERFRAYLERCVGERDGRVLNSAGDEVMAFFARAGDALAAAQAILAGLEQFNARANRLPRPFRVRIGIDSGRCAVDLTRGVAYSSILDTAGHLQKSAPPDAILISDSTYEALGADRPALERVTATSKQVTPAWLYAPRPPEA